MDLKIVAIALALLGTASSTEAGVWKAPQLPMARKLLEHSDSEDSEDCTPDGTFQQFFCENGVLKIGGGYTDDTCTSSPIWNIDYAAMNAAMNGPEACNRMDIETTPVSSTMRCVGDVPMEVFTASADCSGECVSALPLHAQMGGCNPNCGDDDDDDEDGLPTCMSACPQPTSYDMCSHVSGLIASADASCVDACWGTEEEYQVKWMMASCGIVVPGNSGCALADSPPTASPTTVSPTSPSSVSPTVSSTTVSPTVATTTSPTVSSTTVSPTVATTTSPTTLSPPALAAAVLTPASGTGRMSAALGLCVGVAALVAALL